MRLIKAGVQDWGIDSGPAPFRVTNVTFSGVMPGGHASASFEVPVANAYITQHHTLKEGVWISIWDDGHELFEGEILSIKPSVASGVHLLAVECGGMMAVADKRKDVVQTFVHRGTEGWKRLPGTPSGLGSLSFDNGMVDMRVPLGSTEDFHGTSVSNLFSVIFALDEFATDETISYCGYSIAWNVTAEAGGQTWDWWAYYSPDFSAATLFDHRSSSVPPSSSAFTGGAIAPAVGTKCIQIVLTCANANHTVTAEKFVSFKPFVYSSGCTSDPRIDEAMVALATRSGIVVPANVTSKPVGPTIDDLSVGTITSPVSVASGLQVLADLHAQPFEWGFDDGRTFFCRPQTVNPDNDARVIVVGSGRPGLVTWDVANYDEEVPDYACVIYGNRDNAAYPEAWPRRVFRPGVPPDSNVKLETLDYSGTILSDASAAAIGDNLVGRSPAAIPADYIFRFHPERAKSGLWPGNNNDPTGTVQEISDYRATGSTSGLAYTTASGWSGTNSPADPTCLTFDGTNDFVGFGNLTQLNLGGGPRSIALWVKVISYPGTAALLFNKLPNSGTYVGWEVYVTSGGKISALLCQNYGANQFRQATGTTVLSLGVWYHVVCAYEGSGGGWRIYVNGGADEAANNAFSGAWNSDNSTAAVLGMRDPFGAAAYAANISLGEVVIYPRLLGMPEVAQIYNAGQCLYQRSAMKGTVTIIGPVQNRKGALVPAHHVRAGWWIQHTELSTKPLYISGHSVDLAAETNSLTIGEDWMEEQIGVKEAALLALPDTTQAEMDAMNAALQAQTDTFVAAQDAAATAAQDAADAAAAALSAKSLRELGYDYTIPQSEQNSAWDQGIKDDAAAAAQAKWDRDHPPFDRGT